MKNKHILQAISTGWIAGMRSISALVIAGNLISKHYSLLPLSPKLNFLGRPAVSIAVRVLAAAEGVGDKLPATPDRTTPALLSGRAICGAISGAVIYGLARRNPYAGAVVGGITAIISSYTMYTLRKKTKNKTGAPNMVLGLAEDAIVMSTLIGYKKR